MSTQSQVLLESLNYKAERPRGATTHRIIHKACSGYLLSKKKRILKLKLLASATGPAPLNAAGLCVRPTVSRHVTLNMFSVGQHVTSFHSECILCRRASHVMPRCMRFLSLGMSLSSMQDGPPTFIKEQLRVTVKANTRSCRSME